MTIVRELYLRAVVGPRELYIWILVVTTSYGIKLDAATSAGNS